MGIKERIQQHNPLDVKYGSIYTESGMMIDNMSVVIDKKGGLSKYGETTWIKEYYQKTTEKYRAHGFNDMADSLVLVQFDRYKGILSMEEVCTFCNYMIRCSANGDRIMQILSLDEEGMHKKIAELSEIGY